MRGRRYQVIVMMEKILQLLSVRCSHKKISKPFTAGSAPAVQGSSAMWQSVGSRSGPSHYVVCLECGKKFAYDWEQMRIVR